MSGPGGGPPVAELLGRPERVGALDASASWLRGKRVLITGAAGSVGAPLARIVAEAEPESLALLDHHEYSLFGLERALGPVVHRGDGTGSQSVSYELLDVRDTKRLRRVVETLEPRVIFHLAAAKHVPYGERFPEGVVETNVLATESLLELGQKVGVETFVYPSSDKSVDPPSLYGATKRICEALVQRKARESPGRWVVARFVNIVGTRGSVIETFTEQIRQGLPLTITDERMTRYWISMNEAVWLLLQAGGSGEPGQVLMLDCGDPVTVVETARRLARRYCPERDPYPVQVTGIRPGERLHEVLLSRNEQALPAVPAGLMAVVSRRERSALDTVPRTAQALRRLARAGENERLRSAAMAAAEKLQ